MTPEEIVDGALEHGAIQDRQELLQLVTLLIERKIDSVIEVGTYAGGTLHAWCQIAKGMIVSIDYGDVPRSDFLDWHDPALLWTPKMYSQDPSLPDLLEKLNPGGYDFLFIDGGHSKEDAERDYRNLSPLVKKGGVIAFHDTALIPISPDEAYNVKSFWNEIKQGREYLELDSGVNMGMGCLLW